jgi:hypothetical protein
MELNEESSDFVYLGKRIDKALDYIQNSKTDLLDWFKQYVEIPYQDIMSGELDLEEEDYTFDYLDSLLDDLEKKFNVIFETKNKMTQEQLRMQFLSGVITESEYKTKLEELNTPSEKDSLNENFIGMSAINNPFADRKKETYEDAFEHFLSQKYTLNENENQALGTLFYEEDGDYFYNEEKLIELIKNMGYDDAEEIANEIMTISSPEDDLEMFRNKYNQPDLGMEGITLDMIKKSIEDEFEK